MIYSNQISDSLKRFHTYVNENSSYCASHAAGKVSSFWEEHFRDRKNFPDAGEFLSFRRENFVYGIGDTGPASKKKKAEEFNATLKSIQLFTPREFLESLREPILGAPSLFPFGESELSASFVLNAGTTWRIKELITKFGPQRSLHIAEVGAGWGACAMQLHQVCDVASYTIIDLPENLCLSSTYLSLTNLDRQVYFIDCRDSPVEAPTRSSLNFALPPAIDKLAGPYDVIINTMSFQEMDLETVQSYFQWASSSLAQDGLLISFNSHDKAGVTVPSEYFQDGLSLLHIAPFRKVPAGWFNTIPYEMVFKRNLGITDKRLAKRIDVVGELIQFGLDEDLKSPVVQVIKKGGFDLPSTLDTLYDMLYPSSEEEREKALRERIWKGDVLVDFLAANYFFGTGNMVEAHKLLEHSLESGLDGFARVRALAMLTLIGNQVYRASALDLAAGLANELKFLLDEKRLSAFQNHIARIMDCSVATEVPNCRILRAFNKMLNKLIQTDKVSAG